MMKKTTMYWRAAFVLFGAGFIVLNVLAYNHAHAMMHFTSSGQRTHKPEKLSPAAKLKVLFVGVNIPRPVSDRSSADLDADCRRLTLAGPGRVTLAAWYVDRGKDVPLVILFHGYGSEKTRQLEEARAFLELGTSVLLVDFRGSGGSSESYTTIGAQEAEDVAGVVRYARGSLPHSAMVLFGQSMGAAAILRAVEEHGVAPDAVILEAVFDTMLNTVRNRFHVMGVPSFPCAELLLFWGGWQAGFNGFAHNPVRYAESLKCPALFMHGADDPRVRVAENRRVFAAVPGPKEFREFKAVGHESYISMHRDEWKNAVAALLQKVTDRPAAAAGRGTRGKEDPAGNKEIDAHTP